SADIVAGRGDRADTVDRDRAVERHPADRGGTVPHGDVALAADRYRPAHGRSGNGRCAGAQIAPADDGDIAAFAHLGPDAPAAGGEIALVVDVDGAGRGSADDSIGVRTRQNDIADGV